MAGTLRAWNASTPVGYWKDQRGRQIAVYMSPAFAAWMNDFIRAVQRYEAGGYHPASEFWYDTTTSTGGGHIPPFIEAVGG